MARGPGRCYADPRVSVASAALDRQEALSPGESVRPVSALVEHERQREVDHDQHEREPRASKADDGTAADPR